MKITQVETIPIARMGHGVLGYLVLVYTDEEIDPFFFEEPVAPENIDEMAKVAAAINIPVAAGERLYRARPSGGNN